MKPAALFLAIVVPVSLAGCNRADAPADPESHPSTSETETESHIEHVTSPSASAGGHAGHGDATNHAPGEQAGHSVQGPANGGTVHDRGPDETDSTLEPGEYDPTELAGQPSAAIGDITTCPVSGDVFLITEDTAYFDLGEERYFFSSPGCVRRFQRAPDSFLVPASSALGGPPVDVAIAGSRFDPPVSKDRIPAGNWICDMGTVHYASQDHGDGTCPICGMFLVEH